MYQPAHARFTVADRPALLAELAAVVPATLVTLAPDGLRASILPMLYEAEDGELGTLRGHLARPNPQWRDFDTDTDALAIFDGPDAYISPAWYAEKRHTGKVVPTWNYVTVHAHGRLSVRDEPDWLTAHVRRLVERHEAGRSEPWSIDDTPAGYVETQVRAIVGLELRVTRLEAKRKLNQNRPAEDAAGVVEGLEAGTPGERAVAVEMRREERSHR
ncbi:MAG TPA: FMN-binding negative transcriptional regulator [Candidatus Limnocylindria bacterium]|jgi:transcriptional regulator|nr:FMN-binding negative transcriptional regulator [Candidatus Limnocylindria bacterium]